MPFWLELLHKPMPKSIIGSENGAKMIGSNSLGMKLGAGDEFLYIELVKDEHKI